jgi:hypothetical protein
MMVFAGVIKHKLRSILLPASILTATMYYVVTEDAVCRRFATKLFPKEEGMN